MILKNFLKDVCFSSLYFFGIIFLHWSLSAFSLIVYVVVFLAISIIVKMVGLVPFKFLWVVVSVVSYVTTAYLVHKAFDGLKTKEKKSEKNI